jgi:hypothetical protein
VVLIHPVANQAIIIIRCVANLQLTMTRDVAIIRKILVVPEIPYVVQTLPLTMQNAVRI